MYEIRDGKVVKISEIITEVTSESVLSEIDSVKAVISDLEQTLKSLKKDFEIIISLESKIKK